MAKKKPAKKKVVKKKVAKKGSKKNCVARETLCVGSKVKAYIKSKDCMTSADSITALSDKIYDLLDAATERTKANKRSTVKPQDL